MFSLRAFDIKFRIDHQQAMPDRLRPFGGKCFGAALPLLNSMSPLGDFPAKREDLHKGDDEERDGDDMIVVHWLHGVTFAVVSGLFLFKQVKGEPVRALRARPAPPHSCASYLAFSASNG